MTTKKTMPTCPACGKDHDDWQDDIGGVPWGFTSCSTHEEAQADLELLRPWAASHRPALFLWVESVMVPKPPMQEAPLPPVLLPQGWEVQR